MNQLMADILHNAWRNPAQKNLFYSSNGARTGCDRLNALSSWDWTPEPAQGVEGVSTCMFPLALGCPPRRTSEGKEWVDPLITRPRQAEEFRAPDVHAGRTGEVLRNIRAKAKTLEPWGLIREPDIQSPLGVAELMWDESFYSALVEHPKPVHALLDKVTDFIIEFIKGVKAAAGSHLNAVGFPPLYGTSEGTMVSDDSMSLLSPAMHLEFSVPYLNRMAKAVGPLYYHSCTWRTQYFENIHKIENCAALNWNPGNSDDPAVIIAEFSGDAVLTPHIVANMHKDNDLLPFEFEDEVALLRYMVESASENTSLHFWFSNVIAKGDIIERMYDYLDEGGYTPRARGVANE